MHENNELPQLRPEQYVKSILKTSFEWKMSIQVSLMLLPKGPFENMSPFVQMMTWHRIGDKSMSEPKMARFCDDIWCHQATMG